LKTGGSFVASVGVAMGGGRVVNQLREEGQRANGRGADALGAEQGGEVGRLLFVRGADDGFEAIDVHVPRQPVCSGSWAS
jgi:hypothetical protein